jgi:hypothetical protein
MSEFLRVGQVWIKRLPCEPFGKVITILEVYVTALVDESGIRVSQIKCICSRGRTHMMAGDTLFDQFTELFYD